MCITSQFNPITTFFLLYLSHFVFQWLILPNHRAVSINTANSLPGRRAGRCCSLTQNKSAFKWAVRRLKHSITVRTWTFRVFRNLCNLLIVLPLNADHHFALFALVRANKHWSLDDCLLFGAVLCWILRGKQSVTCWLPTWKTSNVAYHFWWVIELLACNLWGLLLNIAR